MAKTLIPPPDKLLGKTNTIPPPEELFGQKQYKVEGINPYPNGEEKANVDDIISNIPDLNEGKKQTIKDLASKGVDKEILSNSILTLQGKHPKQNGFTNYYMDDNNIPVPLNPNERPPSKHDINKMWGTQKEADDDNIVTSTAKHLWNGIIGTVEGQVSQSEIQNPAVTSLYEKLPIDKNYWQGMKNILKSTKFDTKSSEKEPIFNSEGMESWKDIFEPSRYDFSGDKVQGQILNGLESVVSFAIGRGGGLAKGGTAAFQKGLSAMSAYNMSLTPMIDSAREAGLEGRDVYAFATVAAIPQALLESAFGTSGLLTKNAVAKAEMANIAKMVASKLERNEAGEITKEALEKAQKEMTVGALAVTKKFGGEVAKTVGEEAATEGLQQFTEESSKQLYDKLSADPKFNANAFSPESLGKYVNSMIGGALGSLGPSGALVVQNRAIAKDKAQKENIFEVVKQGDGAVNAFKANVNKAHEDGEITTEQAADAIVKVDAYNKYHNDSKDLDLTDGDKKALFDLSFHKADLESQIKGVDEDKLNAIELAKVHGKKKQANDIQKEINEVILAAQVKKETTASKKTIEEIAKKEEPLPADAKKPLIPKGLMATYEKFKNKEEKRTYKDIPTSEYNSEKFNSRIKHAKLTEHLESIPDKKMEGKLVEKQYEYNGKMNSTYAVKLPDGKVIKLASSMERPEKFRGHMRTEHFIDEKDLVGHPIGVKLEYLPEGKKVIKLYNGKTGKFISWAKETHRGLEKPSEAQIDQLEHLQTIIEPPTTGEIEPQTQPIVPIPVQTTKPISNEQQESTPRAEESAAGNIEETTSKGERKAKALVRGTKKANRKIRHPEKIKALNHEVFTPHGLAMQYFIGGGEVNPNSIRKLFKNSLGEIKARISYIRKGAPTIEQIAEQILGANEDLNFDLQDVVNTVEEIVMGYNSSTQMARDLNSVMSEGENTMFDPNEQVMNDQAAIADKDGVGEEFDIAVENLEKLSDESLINIADENGELPKDIIIRDDLTEDQFQKQKVSKGIVEADHHEQILKVAKHIQSVLPKIKVIYDAKLQAAGKLSADGKTISINPYYAGIDTPIHEAGHVLIDAMGYENETIQKAIKQLQKSKLWKEKAKDEHYSKLSEEMLGKEVLAEAIGREGAGIFEKESNISKFNKLLDKIFQWFKEVLGLERNEAKELAKKILRGEASELSGTETGVEQLQKDSTLADNLRDVNAHLKTDLSAEERETWEEIKANILSEIADSDEMAQIEDVVNAESLEGFTLDELIETYNDAQQLGEYDSALTKSLKERIAYYLNEQGKEVLRKNKWFKEDVSKDLNPKEVRFKVLSHIDQNFPELQQLSPIFDKAILDRDTEAKKTKAKLEKLAKAVIKEKNKTLGIKEKAIQLFSSDNARYFEYMDKDGEFITDTSKLSKAQIDLLNFMKDLVKDRKQQIDENGDIIENEILKTDKGFSEMMRSEGVLEATKAYFKLKPQGHSFDYKGRLTNKFDKPRAKDKGYSKDFYAAAQSYIDDISHTKHMSKFVPIVNSLDYLYSKGYGEVLAKPEARKWLNDWAQMHIYQIDKQGYAPADAVMKFFRLLTSQVVMGFNVPAAAMNIFMGNYNGWRTEGVNLSRKNGNLRLMGKGGFNKYGIDLLDKYDVVKTDKDSNPTFGIGQYFQKLAYVLQSFGEFQIQGSMFLGQLSDKDYDSFEYNKDGELVVKEGVDEEALVKRINDIKNKISDVQGKYGAKDRRNFMRSEFGKMAMQFRVWLPDAWKERFGKRYIDLNGNIKEGTFTSLTGEGLKELKQSIKDQGAFKALYNNKAVMANLRGAALIAFFMVLKYQGDDDEKKRKKALSLNNALNNLLFVLDTDQLKYMLKSPVAAFGTANKFVETFDDVIKMDAKELKKDAPKIIPYSKAFTQLEKIFE